MKNWEQKFQDSEDSWSDDSPKRRGKARGKKPAVKAKKALISSYRTARKPGQKTVDYKEKDTDEDLDSDDIIEWDEPRTPAEASASTSSQETIERVSKIIITVETLKRVVLIEQKRTLFLTDFSLWTFILGH